MLWLFAKSSHLAVLLFLAAALDLSLKFVGNVRNACQLGTALGDLTNGQLKFIETL